MVIENFTDVEVVQDLINQVSLLTTFLQAIGGLIFLYILFNIINAIMNKKKNKQLAQINNNLNEIKKILKGNKKGKK